MGVGLYLLPGNDIDISRTALSMNSILGSGRGVDKDVQTGCFLVGTP